MNNEPHGCRTCQNRSYMSNLCGRTSRFVSLASKSEWTEYLRKWENAVAKELASAEKMLKWNPDKKTKAEVERLREEQLSIRAQPLGNIIGNCPHYKHNAVLLPHAERKEGE